MRKPQAVFFYALLFFINNVLTLAAANNGRVVNGTKAKSGEFPFIVSLRRAASGRHACGASLLNAGWALTAAHCVARTKPELINLQYGSNTLDRNATKVANVSRFFVHEQYNPGNKYINDIALLQLAVPLSTGFGGAAVQGVRLPAPGQETPSNSSVTLIGWGLNATGGVVQRHLQKVELQAFSDAECSARHGTQLHASQLCAGVPDGYKGQCSGDSGGPLLHNGTQIGIVSWSRKPCAIPPYPGVFTEVAHYVDWIVRTLAEVMPLSPIDGVVEVTRLQLGELFVERRPSPFAQQVIVNRTKSGSDKFGNK